MDYKFAVYECNITEEKTYKSLQLLGFVFCLCLLAKMKMRVACNVFNEFGTVSVSR